MLLYNIALVALLLSTFSLSQLQLQTLGTLNFPQDRQCSYTPPIICLCTSGQLTNTKQQRGSCCDFLSTKTNLKERLIKLFRPPMVTLCHVFNGCQARPQFHHPVSYLSYRPRRIPKSVQKQLITIRLDVFPRPQRTNFD